MNKAPSITSLSSMNQAPSYFGTAAIRQELDAGSLLAQGFAQHMARIASSIGAPQEAITYLEQAAFAVSQAATAGHVCLHLKDWISERSAGKSALETFPAIRSLPTIPNIEVWREQLFASRLVSDADDADKPLVLDDEHRLYLKRFFDLEMRLAQRLLRPFTGQQLATAPNSPALFKALFQHKSDKPSEANRPTPSATKEESVDWTQIATALSMHRAFTVISGGPGTGKTTSILQLIRCARRFDPKARIFLAAPTGKAANRMLEALQAAASNDSPAEGQLLPSGSYTVHRLLGIQGSIDRSTYHIGNPLPVDLLIVDEASMLDLALAVQLLEAVPPTARIVLIGDKDQLAAVEAGAVFAELSANPGLSLGCITALSRLTGIAREAIQKDQPESAQGLCDHAIWLRHSYRFRNSPALGELVKLVNQGEADTFMKRLRSGEDSEVVWIEDDGASLNSQSRQHLLRGWDPYMEKIKATDLSPKLLFDYLDRYKIICAEREGPRGVIAMNQYVCHMLRQSISPHASSFGVFKSPAGNESCFPGMALMVLQNDYRLGRFNGDIGIVLSDHRQKPVVFFPDTQSPEQAVRLLNMPTFEPAFASTVHKAQGSEYDHVTLILPARSSPVLNRSLLYTAISRAKLGLCIIAGESVLREAIAAKAQRHSGLRRRLSELAQLPDDSARKIINR